MDPVLVSEMVRKCETESSGALLLRKDRPDVWFFGPCYVETKWDHFKRTYYHRLRFLNGGVTFVIENLTAIPTPEKTGFYAYQCTVPYTGKLLITNKIKGLAALYKMELVK